MGRLDGKVALISGGARGQGAEEARLMAQEGAKVVFGDILDDQGQQVEAEITESGLDATYIHLDVTRSSDWETAVDTAVRKYGGLHILVNNAGILIRKGVDDTTEEEWDRIMDINVKGVFLGTKHAIPAMRNSGGGSIVNTSSDAGLIGWSGSAVYTASKWGVIGLTKSAALQYIAEGVRINAVCPGFIRTPMTDSSDPRAEERMIAATPAGRIGTVDEVVGAVLWLCSDEASFVVGHPLSMDGGTTSGMW